MAKAPKAEKKEAKKPVAPKAEKPAPEPEKPAGAGEAKKELKVPKGCVAMNVHDKEGGLVRTFSEEIHGEGFADLASSFVAKHGGKATPATEQAEQAEAGEGAGEGEEDELDA